MNSPFHTGEIEVQSRLGVRELAEDLTSMYRDAISPNVAAFLDQHTFAVISSSDADGNVWASPLAGPAGLLRIPDEHTVAIQRNRLDPPLAPELVAGDLAGLLVIDFDRRLRLRINGTLSSTEDALLVRTKQLYGNCTKYIQRRVAIGPASPQPASVSAYSELNEAHRNWVTWSDTFFIASVHREAGADASHRGGRPGFVTVVDERTLRWPDYRGNNLFNTLGNLEVDPRAGLLFIDFDSGAALQLTGRAALEIAAPSTAAPAGRRIRFEIGAVRELAPAASLRYSLVEPFPYNPPVG